MHQVSLVKPEHCIDACVFFDFWNVDDPNRKYGLDGFPGHWRYLEKLIEEGKIIAPVAVRDELLKTNNQDLLDWLHNHDYMFVEMDENSLKWLAKITQEYQAYTRSAFGRQPTDAILIATAKAEDVTVLSSEMLRPQHNDEDPKIPNVCANPAINVKCVNIRKFFAEAKIEYDIQQG